MKKIELGRQFLKRHINVFKCPHCGAAMIQVADNSIICQNNHRIDLSKYGTLNFLSHHINSEYDAPMLAARQEIVENGLFDGIIDGITEFLPSSGLVVDVGCGEGTVIHKLVPMRPDITWIGFDISVPGVKLATRKQDGSFFCVADLAQLPFADNSATAILNIFSPSAYTGFDRILKPEGRLIKIIPNTDYLTELRQSLYPNESKATYDNQPVLDRFYQRYPAGQQKEIRYTYQLSFDQRQQLLAMSPLAWQASNAQKQHYLSSELDQITISVLALVNQ